MKVQWTSYRKADAQRVNKLEIEPSGSRQDEILLEVYRTGDDTPPDRYHVELHGGVPVLMRDA